MLTVRQSQQRGQASFNWLKSQHTFSFGDYYDAKHMGFSALRVINDDIVSPGAGFDTHAHRDMEIISYVLSGAIEHRDSEGNVKVLPAGEFQLMSAGSGIYHSEYNASPSEPLRFLQIWIQPNTFGNPPSYAQKDFGQLPGLTTIATPSGAHGTLAIKQDMTLHQLRLEPGMDLVLPIDADRRVYVHVVTGTLRIGDTQLNDGDGAKIEHEAHLTLTNSDPRLVTALVFDLP